LVDAPEAVEEDGEAAGGVSGLGLSFAVAVFFAALESFGAGSLGGCSACALRDVLLARHEDRVSGRMKSRCMLFMGVPPLGATGSAPRAHSGRDRWEGQAKFKFPLCLFLVICRLQETRICPGAGLRHARIRAAEVAAVGEPYCLLPGSYRMVGLWFDESSKEGVTYFRVPASYSREELQRGRSCRSAASDFWA
jgi:hypothetical protein